jgi:hypothetical protein
LKHLNMDPYLTGLLYGDGTSYLAKNGAYSVWIDQVDHGILDQEVVPRLQKMNFKVHFYDYTSRTDGRHKWRALVFSKDLFVWFRSMRVDILDVVAKMKAREFKRFLAGFFDAEGTKTDRVVIYNKNRKLLSLIQKKLGRIGVSSYIYKFGRVYGIQIYRKLDAEKFCRLVQSYRLKARSAG